MLTPVDRTGGLQAERLNQARTTKDHESEHPILGDSSGNWSTPDFRRHRPVTVF
jgi:hypothetical protein